MWNELIKKLPANAVNVAFKVAFVLAIALISFVAYESLVVGRPFIFADKSYGFAPDKSKENAKDLEDCRSAYQGKQEELVTSQKEKETLLDENRKLKAEQSALEAHNVSTWFFVDDVNFSEEGKYTTRDGKQPGRGKWSSPDKDLMLSAIEIHSGEVILETNLPPPGNMISLGPERAWTLPTEKWEYRVFLLSGYSFSAQVRVERRKRTNDQT